jgi:ABC-type proline/glycine betaine transport system ATPase subunit
MNTDLTWYTQNHRNNHKLFPKFILGVIIGSSGCGKTNWIRNALIQPDKQWLDYNRLYIFGKSLHQIEYQIIKRAFELNLSKNDIFKIFSRQHYIHESGIDVFDVIEQISKRKKHRDEPEVETF